MTQPAPPTTVEQVTAIVGVLDAHDVDYVLIGGMAAQMQGVPIGVTQVADFNASQSPQDLVRLEAALAEMGATVHVEGATQCASHSAVRARPTGVADLPSVAPAARPAHMMYGRTRPSGNGSSAVRSLRSALQRTTRR